MVEIAVNAEDTESSKLSKGELVNVSEFFTCSLLSAQFNAEDRGYSDGSSGYVGRVFLAEHFGNRTSPELAAVIARIYSKSRQSPKLLDEAWTSGM